MDLACASRQSLSSRGVHGGVTDTPMMGRSVGCGQDPEVFLMGGKFSERSAESPPSPPQAKKNWAKPV